MKNTFPVLTQHSQKKEDARGFLEVLYEANGVVLKRSFSKKGVFRGMHMQALPNEQTKLIRVIRGRIIDFVIEPNGVNEIRWQEIEAGNDWIKIDAKFAHGFYALEDTDFEYICDGAYMESAEKSYSIVDFLKNVLQLDDLILSEKDAKAPRLNCTPVLVDRNPV